MKHNKKFLEIDGGQGDMITDTYEDTVFKTLFVANILGNITKFAIPLNYYNKLLSNLNKISPEEFIDFDYTIRMPIENIYIEKNKTVGEFEIVGNMFINLDIIENTDKNFEVKLSYDFLAKYNEVDNDNYIYNWLSLNKSYEFYNRENKDEAILLYVDPEIATIFINKAFNDMIKSKFLFPSNFINPMELASCKEPLEELVQQINDVNKDLILY